MPRAIPQADKTVLRRNFSWTLTGNSVYAASQFGLLVAVAKLGSPEMVGQFSLGVAVATPTIALSQMQLRALQATDAGRNRFLPGDYLAVRLKSTALAVALVVVAVLNLNYESTTRWVIINVTLAKAAESISDVYYGLAQQYEKMAFVATSMIARGILSLVVLSVAIATTQNSVMAAAILAIVWLLLLLLYDVGIASRTIGTSIRPTWNLGRSWRLAAEAFPLGIVTLLLALNTSIPRYFLQYYLGERHLGIFTALASIQPAGMVIVNAFGQSAAPRLASYYHAGETRAFFALLRLLFALAAVPAIGVILVACLMPGILLTSLYGHEYAAYRVAFLYIAVAAAMSFIGSVLGYAATSARKIQHQPKALLVVAGVTVAGCALLIPRYGILGAAAASILSAVASCLTYGVVLLYPFGHPFRKSSR